MPTYDVEVNGRVFTVEAPNMNAARQTANRQAAFPPSTRNVPNVPLDLRPTANLNAMQDAVRLTHNQFGTPAAPTVDPMANFTQRYRQGEGTHYLPGDPNDPTPEPVTDSRLNRGIANGALQGPTLNLGDEIVGLVGGVGGAVDPNRTFRQGYDTSRDAFNADLAYAQQKAPGDVGLSAALMGLLGGAGMSSTGLTLMRGARPTVGSIVSRSGIEGGLYGGVAGAGAGDTPYERGMGALFGAATGAATGIGLGAATGQRSVAAINRSVPNSAERGAAANAAYATGRAAGVGVHQNIADSIQSLMVFNAEQNRLNEELSPMAWRYVQNLSKRPVPSTLDDLETFRQELRDLASTGNANDLRIATGMIRDLDQQLSNLAPASFIGNADPTAAFEAFQEGRAQWSLRARARAIERAETVAANAPNASIDPAARQRAVVTQFRRIANDPDFQTMWSPEEQAQILSVVRGGTIDNKLAQLANAVNPMRLTPGTMASTVAAGGLGFQASGGHGAGAAAALIPPIIGGGVRGTSRLIANSNAELTKLLIRNDMQFPQTIKPAQGALISALLAASNQAVGAH